jgi:hypothetical protein
LSGKLFWTSGLVARELGITTETFLRRRAELEDLHGFPLPLPHALRPMLWRADQVRAWLDAQGLPKEAEVEIPAGANVILLREARVA